jgi:hypothetical protein
LLCLPEQGEQEKTKTDGVCSDSSWQWCHTPPWSVGDVHLHPYGASHRMGWFAPYWSTPAWAQIGRVPQVNLWSRGYMSNRREVRDRVLSHSLLECWCGSSFLEWVQNQAKFSRGN